MNDDEKHARERVEEVNNLKDIFNSEKGLDVLYKLCKRFHYFQPSYTGNVNDCLFREGERNVINYIMTELEQDPAKILDQYRQRLRKEQNYED